MLDFTAKFTEKDDGYKAIKEALAELENTEVLVGIMEEAGVHDSETQTGITNAELLFIHTHGSPLNGLPARPVLEPAIEHGKEQIGALLKKATEIALTGDKEGVRAALEKVGEHGAGLAQKWFTNEANGWPNLKPSAIYSREARKAKARGGKISKAKREQLKEIRLSGDTSGANPLIDTGEMRKAITYKVSKKI